MQLSGQTVDSKLRSDFLSQGSRFVEREQLRRREFNGGPRAQHGRLPLQSNRPEQPRSVRIPLRLHAHDQSSLRSHLQLLQGDRRPHRSRLHHPGPTARLHQLRSEANGAGLAVDRQLEFPERGARRLQPGTSAVPQRLGVQRQSVHDGAWHHQPDWRQWHGHRLPASGPVHQHLPDQRHREPDARQSRDSDGRQLAAKSRQSLQLCRGVPAGELRLQCGRAKQPGASIKSVPGRDCCRGSEQRQRDGRMAGGHGHVCRADLPGAEPELGLRRGRAFGRELHARQHRRLRAGQLAMEAKLYGAIGPQVGVLQPPEGGQQPGFPADSQ